MLAGMILSKGNASGSLCSVPLSCSAMVGILPRTAYLATNACGFKSDAVNGSAGMKLSPAVALRVWCNILDLIFENANSSCGL